MADRADNNLADSGNHERRWFGARGDAAQNALGLALEMALKRLDGYLVQMFDRVDDVLFDRAEKAANPEVHNQYFDALRNVRLVHPDVRTNFSALIIQAFEQGCPRNTETPSELRLHSDNESSDDHCSAEEELAFTGLVRKIRTNCGDSLRPLERRVGFLLEDPDLECWDNPLGPQNLCDAFRKAAEPIKADLVVRLVIFKVFDQKVAARLRGFYREIDRALLKLDVLPGMKSRHPETSDTRAIPMASGIEPSQASAPAAPTEDVRMAQGIVPGRQVGHLDATEAALSMAEGIEADSSSRPLDNLAETVPMAPGIVPSGLARTPFPDADSVPMAAGIVPSGHNLRPTVACEPVAADPEPQAVAPAQPAPARLPETSSREKMESAQDRLQVAEDKAINAIRACIDGDIEQKFVKTFVAGHWKDLLKLVCMRDGEDSGAWKQATATVNDLVWSVKPKTSEQQRERLSLIRSRLLHNLRKGMQRLSLAADRCDEFIDSLEQEYSRLLGEQAACLETIEPLVLDEETPEEVDAAANVFIRQPVNIASESRSGLKDWQNGDRYMQMASSLETGDWVEFSCSKGKITRAKLTWNSPITNTLLFTDKQGLQAGNYTLEEFAGMLRLSRARLLGGASRTARSVKAHR